MTDQTLIKSDSKDIYNVTKYSFHQRILEKKYILQFTQKY